MMCLKFLLILIFPLIASTTSCRNEENFQFHLSSKTPYRMVANYNATKPEFKGCEPQKIWMFIRHGTRNPNSHLIKDMKERLPEIRDLILENNPTANERLSNPLLHALKQWNSKLEPAHSKKLTIEGENEMLELAERMQGRFPSLFSFAYSNTSYFFKYTGTQRTKLSAKYFAAGLFGRQTVRDVWFPTPLDGDPVLRSYKVCNKWVSDIKKNPDTLHERRQFDNSSIMLRLIKSVNRKLNLKGRKSVSYEDVFAMYTTCAFETAWNKKKTSPWCSVLPPESFKLLEYAQDLTYYYRDGYGFELTAVQTCPALNDMIKYFQDESPYPKSMVYFSHSGSLLKMLALLGLYKDEKPLKHDNFKNNDNRKWKVSKIGPFGSNLAVVMYKCRQNKKKIAVLHQEELLQLPHCDELLCDLQEVKEYYNQDIQECNFDEICKNFNSV